MRLLPALALFALATLAAAEPIFPENSPEARSEWELFMEDTMANLGLGAYIGTPQFGDLVCILSDMETLTMFCGVVPEPSAILCRIVPGGLQCIDVPPGSLKLL